VNVVNVVCYFYQNRKKKKEKDRAMLLVGLAIREKEMVPGTFTTFTYRRKSFALLK
jgi:hypothetical protein